MPAIYLETVRLKLFDVIIMRRKYMNEVTFLRLLA